MDQTIANPGALRKQLLAAPLRPVRRPAVEHIDDELLVN